MPCSRPSYGFGSWSGTWRERRLRWAGWQQRTDRGLRHPPDTQSIETQVGQLSLAARKLSVIGAALRVRNDPDADSRVSALVTSTAETILGAGLEALDEREISTLLRMIEMGFAEAVELFREPARPAEWQVTDQVLLQSQGRASSQAFQRILALSAARPLLRDSFRGRFLDVGTGVAGIALEAAKSCPLLQVDGIDIWEPALVLAKRNVAGSPYADRIRIKHLDVLELATDPVYTLVWLPTMFMTRSVVEAALGRIAAASRENAYLVAARYTVPTAPAAAAFVALRTLRSGGEQIEQSELEDMLHVRGFVGIETDVSPLASFTLGRRP